MFIICTLHDNNNYGNRLQNFALSELLKSYGEVTTIYTVSHANTLLKLFKYIFKQVIILVYSKLMALVDNGHHPGAVKNLKFHSFNKKNIGRTKYFASPVTGIVPLPKASDTFVFGSDQIWNPLYSTSEQLIFNLGSFVARNKKISYAPSLGQDSISSDKSDVFRRYFPTFSNISIREFKGKELLQDLTESNISVVLDPTLMLTSQQWNKITCDFVSDNDLYVLTYFLGKPSNRQEQTIQKYARTYGYRIRRILDLRDSQTYTAGPQDFVELFSKAQYVFTDSYHACCFSLLFHKQFTVFNRAGMGDKANMNSRMETLFRLFDLDSVVMDEGLAPHIDYEKVDILLARHRAESRVWLDKAILEE